MSKRFKWEQSGTVSGPAPLQMNAGATVDHMTSFLQLICSSSCIQFLKSSFKGSLENAAWRACVRNKEGNHHDIFHICVNLKSCGGSNNPGWQSVMSGADCSCSGVLHGESWVTRRAGRLTDPQQGAPL